MDLVELLIAVLVVALVWVICGALGLPYVISLVVTILAALLLLRGPIGVVGGRWRRGP